MTEIKEISINVSKKIGQPEFGSIMLSASITIEAGDENVAEAYKKGWAICWEEIEKQEKELKDNKELEETIKEFENTDRNAVGGVEAPVKPVDPVCGIHGTVMTWRNAGVSKTTGKSYPGFWACPTKNVDGTFCKYKPK